MKNDENHKTDEGCPTFQVFNQLAKEDECNIEDVNDGISCKNFTNKIDRCMKCSRILKIMKDNESRYKIMNCLYLSKNHMLCEIYEI